MSKACHDAGLLTLTCGTYGNVFRFLPPLAIGDDLLAEGLDIFEATRSMIWPGEAAVAVSVVHLAKGDARAGVHGRRLDRGSRR